MFSGVKPKGRKTVTKRRKERDTRYKGVERQKEEKKWRKEGGGKSPGYVLLPAESI